jgi:hypothetical protein
VIGHARAERIVLRALGGILAGPLLGLVCAAARFLARPAFTALRDTLPPREPSARRSSWSAASLIAWR